MDTCKFSFTHDYIRLYLGLDNSRTHMLFYTSRFGFKDVMKLIGPTEISVKMFSGYYPGENDIGFAEFIFGERHSVDIEPFRKSESARKFLKFVQDRNLDVVDYEIETVAGTIYNSGYPGECLVMSPVNLDLDEITATFIQKLGLPRKVLSLLSNYQRTFILIDGRGNLRTFESMSFDTYWKDWDYFQRFPEAHSAQKDEC